MLPQVAHCRAAGIRVVMVTRDEGPTTEAIARRIDLVGERAHVLVRVYGFVGLLEGRVGIAAFLFASVLHGWAPWQPLASAGPRYLEVTTMTQTAIVMGEMGTDLAARTNRLSIRAVGLLRRRFLVVGIVFELVLAAALVYVPGLNRLFHQAPLGPWHWLFLATWPPAREGRNRIGAGPDARLASEPYA